jgi:hypothetical protein
VKNSVIYYYTFIKSDEEPVWSGLLTLATKDKDVAYFEYKFLRYMRTNKYTSQSVKNIKDIATRMVPDLKKEYGIK